MNDPQPVTPSPTIQPGTTVLDILKYLLTSQSGTGIGSKSLKGLLAAILTWWSVDKARSFKDGASLSDVTKWQTEVSNRLERLEAYATAPPTNPNPLDVRRQTAFRRPPAVAQPFIPGK